MSATTVPRPFRVVSKRSETADTWTLTLRPAEPGGGLAFEPGQFAMLHSFGAGEVPISVSGDPSDPDAIVHTVRSVGDATRSICGASEGSILGVRGPFGSCWPLGAAEGIDLLLVAGGLGLAPLRPALYAALAGRRRFGRVVLLYGGRSPDELLFDEELERWRADEGLECSVTVDVAGEGWRGSVGVVPALIERARLDPARTVALICGPEVMMRFSVLALVGLGLPADRVFVSIERNMRCALGHCGHCQLGPTFVCRDGPVFSWSRIGPWFGVREL